MTTKRYEMCDHLFARMLTCYLYSVAIPNRYTDLFLDTFAWNPIERVFTCRYYCHLPELKHHFLIAIVFLCCGFNVRVCVEIPASPPPPFIFVTVVQIMDLMVCTYSLELEEMTFLRHNIEMVYHLMRTSVRIFAWWVAITRIFWSKFMHRKKRRLMKKGGANKPDELFKIGR